MKRHKWKWSPSCNGRAKCRVCGARFRRKHGIGPKGGEMWIVTMPGREPVAIPREHRLIPPCPGPSKETNT